LSGAVKAGDWLVSHAERTNSGGVCWAIPSGYGELSGRRYIGYAYGAAGVADALLDLFEATSDERYLNAARGAADWLRHVAIAVLADGSGLGWPLEEGQPPCPPVWAHGSAGICKFFLHMDRLGVAVPGDDTARRAAKTTARGARWAAPNQCLGLAGNIEVLLEAFQATGDKHYLSDANALGVHASIVCHISGRYAYMAFRTRRRCPA
jgi:lantibiotic modifying enzyme